MEERGSRFQFKEYEARKALKVFGWSFASAMVTLGIALLTAVDIPASYAWMIPAVNTILYAIKEFIADNIETQ